MASKVTDPALIDQLNAGAATKKKVTDPTVLQQLNSSPIVNGTPMRAEMPAGMSEAGGDAPYTPSSVPWLDPINALGTSFAENIPVIGKPLSDFGNSVDAAFASAVEGKPVTDEERAKITEDEQRKFPAASVTGAVAGNVLPLAPLAATRLGAAAFGLTGPLAARVGLGGLSGAAVGGADALVDSGGDLNAALNGAAWGGVGGAAGGAAAPYIDDVTNWLTKSLGLRSQIAADNVSKPARDILQRSIGSTGGFGPEGAAAIRASGPGGMLVDASPAARDVLDTALQRSGPGAYPARTAVENRAAEANKTVTGALDEALGPPQGVKTTETGLRTGSASARTKAYEEAYASPIDYSSPTGVEIEGMLTRVPQGVIGLANRMMQLEGQQSKQILAKIAEDGTVTYLRQPDVRQIDYITRALNQAAKSGEGQGALGGQTDIGRAYGMLARDIRDATRAAVPAYDTALQTAASPIQQREALRYGEGLLSPSVARDEAREVISGFTKPQMAMIRQGVRSRIEEVVANVNDIVSNPNIDAREALKAWNDLSSRAARDKITMILDDNGASNRLFAELAKARKALELRAGVATNSRTFGRTAVDQAVKEHVTGGVGGALLRGEPLQLGKAAVQSVTGKTPTGDRVAADKVYEELARLLTTQGDDALAMLSSLAMRFKNPRAPAPYLPGATQAAADYGPPVISR